MGAILRTLSRVRFDWLWTTLQWLETNIVDRSLIELDSALRFVSNGRLGDVYNTIELFLEDVYEKLTRNPDDEFPQYCIDHDGLHAIGDEWQNEGQCNLRKCVGQNTMKQWTCKKLEPRSRCKIRSGEAGKPYPECCDQYDCENFVDNPIVVHNQENRWTYEHFDPCDEQF